MIDDRKLNLPAVEKVFKVGNRIGKPKRKRKVTALFYELRKTEKQLVTSI